METTQQIRVGLGVKFVLLVVGILSITLGVVTTIVVNSQNKLFQEQLTEKGHVLGGFVSLILPELILSYDFSSMEAYMKEVVSRKDMVYSVVVDNQGNAMTSYMDKENSYIELALNAITGKKIEDILVVLKQNKIIIHFEFPIMYNNKQQGSVLMGISRDRLERLAYQVLLKQLLSNVVIIVFLSLSIYLVFRYSAMRPIKSLIAGSVNISKGNLDKPVAVYSRDELGNLSIAFNKMMQQLKTTIAEKDLAMDKLSNLNATLEDRVRLRTTELEISETRIRTILDNIGEGIIVIDENGLINSLNPAAKTMFSTMDIDCTGMHVIKLLLNQNAEGLREAFGLNINKDKMFKERIASHRAEIEGQRMDGSVFPIELVITSMRLGDENLHTCVMRDITRRKKIEFHLAEAQKDIINAAHKSGMAEIAIGVLHNIGNILNSVNISVEEVSRIAGNSKVKSLNKANAMLSENMGNLQEFFSSDNKGKRLLEYYIKLGSILEEESNQIIDETKSLKEKTIMMKDVISTQQAYATAGVRVDGFQITPIIEDALKVQGASLRIRGVNVTKNIQEMPIILGQKSKLLQVITNLIKNAKEATYENDSLNKEKEIEIDVGIYKNTSVYVSITDNGVGIKEEDLSNIFNHGFTTKEKGHGFGLHTSANSMAEMGGTLTVSSDGVNMGACFTISIPIADSKRQDKFSDDVVLPQKTVAKN